MIINKIRCFVFQNIDGNKYFTEYTNKGLRYHGVQDGVPRQCMADHVTECYQSCHVEDTSTWLHQVAENEP